MPPRPVRARWRVASVVLVPAFAGLALAPPALASQMGEDTAPAPRVSPAQPVIHEFVVLQPSVSPALIGLAIAQMTTQPAQPQLATPQPAVQVMPAIGRPTARPRGLVPLFASYAVLQALDVHSTLRAINGGAVEGNPVMGPIVNRPGAMVAFKAATTVGAVFAAERLARHNRFAAYGLMFALNSAYAFIVVHNYRVAAR